MYSEGQYGRRNRYDSCISSEVLFEAWVRPVPTSAPEYEALIYNKWIAVVIFEAVA